jgi:hypothetical protein
MRSAAPLRSGRAFIEYSVRRAAVQKYPVRPSHRPNLAPAALEGLLRTHFGSAEGTGEERSTSYGAISHLTVRAEGRELRVEVTMNPQVPEDVARETIARYNRFLEQTCGYTAKERAKRLKKSSATPESGE